MVPYTLISELTAIYTLYNVSRTGIGIVAWVASVSNQVISRKLRKHVLRRQSLVQWNLSFGTPLIKGHLHSGHTELGKMLSKSLYLLPLLRGLLYSGERNTFSGCRNLGLTFIQRTLQNLKRD